MFDGYWMFGGEEVVNHARTQAYLDGGYRPGGSVTTAEADDDLAMLRQVVNDGREYASPVIDGAPWVETGDADTWDFAGPIVLNVTGAEGSTRTAAVTEYATNGGTAGVPRYGTRTVAVTALLVGRTSASVQAGLSWLSMVLAGDCSPGMGAELCAMSALPEEYNDAPIVPSDPITEEVDRRVDGWHVSMGRFRNRDGWFNPSAAAPGEVGLLGSARLGFSVLGNTGPRLGQAILGSAVLGVDPDAPEPFLAAPAQQCYSGPVSWHWNLSTLRGAVDVSVGAMDEAGTVLTRTTTQTIQGEAALAFTPDPAWESWVPVLWVRGNAVKVDPTITHTPYRTAAQCADTYLRSYLDVTTVDGPSVVQRLTFPCGQYALKVEWTWLVGNPFIFGAITPLVTGFSTATAEALALESGVQTGRVDAIMTTADTGACTTPASPVVLGVVDPCAPGFLPPPRPPVIEDVVYAPPDSWRRYTFSVPARLATSNNDGLLGLTITNDERPKRGVRLRLYTDPLNRGLGGINECDFCAEFTLTYVPPDSTLTIDAARRRVTTTLPGATVINTAASVRGPAGGPFDYPALQCSIAHLVVLDVPDNYDRACAPYAAGDAQGDLQFDLTLTPATI